VEEGGKKVCARTGRQGEVSESRKRRVARGEGRTRIGSDTADDTHVCALIDLSEGGESESEAGERKKHPREGFPFFKVESGVGVKQSLRHLFSHAPSYLPRIPSQAVEAAEKIVRR
jgi:hypothetical protein